MPVLCSSGCSRTTRIEIDEVAVGVVEHLTDGTLLAGEERTCCPRTLPRRPCSAAGWKPFDDRGEQCLFSPTHGMIDWISHHLLRLSVFTAWLCPGIPPAGAPPEVVFPIKRKGCCHCPSSPGGRAGRPHPPPCLSCRALSVSSSLQREDNFHRCRAVLFLMRSTKSLCITRKSPPFGFDVIWLAFSPRRRPFGWPGRQNHVGLHGEQRWVRDFHELDISSAAQCP